MKRGFTLVELSIVLVIIGLLIGGILAAQSMIETAKVNNVVRQIQQYDVAVSNFQTKYNSLPGDSLFFGCAVVGASICGNGLIEDGGGAGGNFQGELANFWPNLQQSGFYNAQPFSNTVPVTFNSDPNNPNAPILHGSKDGQVLAGYCAYTSTTNCWEIMDRTSSTIYPSPKVPTFSVEMALAIDTKMDDGKPYTGSVRHWYSTASMEYIGVSTNPCTNSTSSYYLSGAGTPCLLSISMFSQVGQIQ